MFTVLNSLYGKVFIWSCYLFEPFVGMKLNYVYKVWASVKEHKLFVGIYHTSSICNYTYQQSPKI